MNCQSTTKQEKPCLNKVKKGQEFCHVHTSRVRSASVREIRNEKEDNPKNQIINFLNHHPEVSQLYKIDSFISKGNYGIVLKGTTRVGSNVVAIKIEEIEEGRSNKITDEFRLLRQFSKDSHHLPLVYDLFCELSKQYDSMFIMDLLGCDLKSWISKQSQPIPKKVLHHIIHQLIESMAQLHSYEIVHEDIKLDNFCVAYGDDKSEFPLLKLIDFGGAETISLIKRNNQIDYPPPGLVGNPLNASLTAEKIDYQTYTDDMESIGYIIWKLINGSLPWEHTPPDDAKSRINLKTHCTTQTEVPENIRNYIRKCRSIPKFEMPDYQELLLLLLPKTNYKISLKGKDTHRVDMSNRYANCSPEFVIERKFFNIRHSEQLSEMTIPGLRSVDIALLAQHGITTRIQLYRKVSQVKHKLDWFIEIGIPKEGITLMMDAWIKFYGKG